MEKVQVSVQERSEFKKSDNNKLRISGRVPAVVYHRGTKTAAVSVDNKQLNVALHTEAGRNVLIDLKVEDSKAKSKVVVVKDMQHHPVSGNLLHVDFHEISLKEKIRVHVPIVEKGEPVGVTVDGGVLDSPVREIEVECLPTAMPEHINIDISGLKLNEALHVSDLKLPEGAEAITDKDTVIVRVMPPHVEEEKTDEEGESAEPEVIGAKPEDGEAAEAGGDAKPKE